MAVDPTVHAMTKAHTQGNAMANYSSPDRWAAVRQVFTLETRASSRWAAIVDVAMSIGCSPTTLRRWVRVAEQQKQKVPANRRSGAAARSRADLAAA